MVGVNTDWGYCTICATAPFFSFAEVRECLRTI
nr:MAG TPA: hypothetical protein [Caudoviricetes sp.]